MFKRIISIRRLLLGSLQSSLTPSRPLPNADGIGGLRRLGRFIVRLTAFIVVSQHIAVETPTGNHGNQLAEAQRLAWLNNWIDAAREIDHLEADGLLPRAESVQLFARATHIRGNIESLPLPVAAAEIASMLNTVSGRTDVELRVQLLAIKGDIEFQYDLPAAQEDWEQVKGIAESHSLSDWASRADGELGTIDFLNGQIFRAVRRVSGALLRAELSKDVAAQIRYRTALGEGLNEFGRKADAIRFFDKALTLAAETPGAYFPFTAYLGKARLLADSARRVEGIRMLQAGLAEAREQGLRVREARILTVLGEIAVDHKEVQQAGQWLTSAADVARSAGLDRIEADAATALAALLLNEEDLARAAVYARRSVEATKRARDFYHLPQAMAVWAEIEARCGRSSEAERIFTEAADLVDDLLRNFPQSRHKNTLIATMSRVFQGYVDLALHGLQDPQKAFHVLESAKARGLVDSLRYPERRPGTGFAWDAQPAREVTLLQRDLASEDDSGRRNALLDRLWELEQRSFRLREVRSSQDEPRKSRPVEVGQLQDRLSKGELVLEYLLGPSQSFVLAIEKNRVMHYELASSEVIASAVSAHLAAVKAGHDAGTEARTLYRLLLDPVEPLVRNARLVIVPDAVLHLVPFGALIDSHGEYLDESHIVSYVPSSTAYYLLSKPRNHNSRVALLGVGGIPYEQSMTNVVRSRWRGIGLFNSERRPHWTPLPQSLTEVQDIAAAHLGPTQLLIAGDANEARLRSLDLPAFRVLHLAVHSTIDTEFPDRSALVLSSNSAANDDGLLQAREILALHLDADLVTLSACDGGVGAIEGIAGINSLVEAFLMAGARSVVATVWDADDTFTASLMRRFYAHLQHGSDKAEALALAKRDLLRRHGPDALPFYWAGFRIVGDPNGKLAGDQHE